MTKVELRKIDYQTFRDFLVSSKDEIGYFDVKTTDTSRIITLDEYWNNFKSSRDAFLEEIQPLLEKIRERNNWIGKDFSATSSGRLLFFDQYYELPIVDIMKVKEKDRFKNVDLFDMDWFPFSFFGNLPGSIESAFLAARVIQNSKTELLKIVSIAERYFSPAYESRATESNIFYAENNTSKGNLSVQCGEKLKGIVYADMRGQEVDYNVSFLEGSFTDLPVDYTYKSPAILLSGDEAKVLAKKVYVRR